MRTRLLIVEDDPISLQVLQLILQSQGIYEIATAATVAEALERAERFRPALIISDRFLGKEDGLDLCRRVKADPDLKAPMFILLTAAAETAHKVTGLDAGADDYITKPYNDEELLSRVRALLRIKSLQDDLSSEKAELERLNSTLNESLHGTANLLTNIIELRVPNALARARRAYALVHWLGQRLELDRPTRELLDLAARIHEIGKVTVPDEILCRKPIEMSEDERETFWHFPVFGQMIVGNVPQLKALAKMLRHQLENYDGTGHPDHLMEREIPLPSRVLRVVNFIEELRADGIHAHGAIVERLRAAQGTIVEPRLAHLGEEYLVAAVDDEWMVGKKQVAVPDIEEGMVLAFDLCTAGGMKLMPKDSKLTRAQVEYIRAHHRNDPIAHGVYVYALD